MELGQTIAPHGLATTRLYHLEQSGHADLVKRKLTEADRELLRTVEVAGTTLEGYVDQWFTTADELGQVSRRRAQIVLDRPSLGRQRSEARSAWIGLVHVLRSLVPHADFNEDQRLVIFGPFDQL